jgi:hypothetical protein
LSWRYGRRRTNDPGLRSAAGTHYQAAFAEHRFNIAAKIFRVQQAPSHVTQSLDRFSMRKYT